MIIWVCCGSQQAHAIECDHLIKVYQKILSENLTIEGKYSGKKMSPEEDCRVGREEVLPFIEKSLHELKSYSDCPGKHIVRDTILYFQEQQALLEADNIKLCK
jgi:hypothetical protein